MTTADDRTPAPGSDIPPAGHADDPEYSATVLASHWFQRPEPDTTLVEDRTVQLPPGQETPPDRVEGTVLRFGPGVTAALAHRSHTTLPKLTVPAPRPRRGLRRHALPALVLIVVIAFLAWHRSTTALGLEAVTVTTRQTTVECDGTADIVGLLTTNGRPGTVSYRWVRSDGTTSDVLREVTPQGRKQARVHLLWTFQGEGRYRAQAELHILSPTRDTATIQFTYDCF
ncbi:hypothetical protein [Streptomyces luteolifulvus]|uniref:hypothetical protein n=1 Tax=Streptomyces luteolifulvus TaxID=2615112 RepID=UPI001CD97A32|nr:hypothetical protein [Streptomyces luteolifulvus]